MTKAAGAFRCHPQRIPKLLLCLGTGLGEVKEQVAKRGSPRVLDDQLGVFRVFHEPRHGIVLHHVVNVLLSGSEQVRLRGSPALYLDVDRVAYLVRNVDLVDRIRR